MFYLCVGMVVFKVKGSTGMHNTTKNDCALLIFDQFADIEEPNL